MINMSGPFIVTIVYLNHFHPTIALDFIVADASASQGGNDQWDISLERDKQKMASVMAIPIAQFELSVRSRNCLQKMGIMSLGDLTRIAETDLLMSKNFGETSLTEIREMMSNKGLMVGQFAHDSETESEPMDLSHLTPDEQMLLERPISDLNLSVRARKCMT